MTDKEIIKALKEMLERTLYEGELQRASIISKALDLINRQKAEIERYERENNSKFNKWKLLDERTKKRYADLYETAKDVAKAEAVKEFAERLKAEAEGYDLCGDGVTYQMIDIDNVDNLVKEITEQRKEDEGKYNHHKQSLA